MSRQSAMEWRKTAELAAAAIALAEGVRRVADTPAETLVDRRHATANIALAHGATPERAAEIAESAERVLTEFADALLAAARAARNVQKLSELYAEKIPDNAPAS